MIELPFDQVFHPRDLLSVGVLIVLEGALSVDNALVLGLLARRLPPEQRKKALTYGLVGAFVFRFAAIGAAAWMLKYPIVKLLGGGYLIYIAVKHFLFGDKEAQAEKSHIRLGPDGHPILDEEADKGDLTPEYREEAIHQRSPIPQSGLLNEPAAPGDPMRHVRKYAKFWPTVFVIELTDIAFAVDSIVSAMAFLPPQSPERETKLWVVILGGFIGVILMRFAAVIFIRLLERFPRFEAAAYLLVIVIGLKLVIDWGGNLLLATETNKHPINFHDITGPAFWTFWVLMIVCFAYGFMKKKETSPAAAS